MYINFFTFLTHNRIITLQDYFVHSAITTICSDNITRQKQSIDIVEQILL